ncbi:saccharopine dehydrogenase [Aspergillus luchuensis]|uniref:Saccharopine dehydrogenase n=1 Tax=Aspergillus kawachii TaxID=1069201 RepID=A0A146FI00_ASPKA|nr:saccharopine dehydrogenase [Aspergillus luchuensis]
MENTDHYVFSYRYGRRGLKFGAEKEAMWSTSKKMRDFEATMSSEIAMTNDDWRTSNAALNPMDPELLELKLEGGS